ncbi:MAG: maleylpyruvate isomerase family mycothiol-dependent enzyme [Microthrixaceae bacterium]
MTDHGALLGCLAGDVGTAGEILVATPDAAVSHCPGWTVADLIRHHGGVHRWATSIVETGEPAPAEFVGPDDIAALAAWYADGASRLIAVLTDTDPARACWTFGRRPGEAWFWTRRQALEAAVHRWDAQTAVGDADGFPAQIVAAGISEVVEDLFPRQIALGRSAPLTASVVLDATDLDRRWTMAGRGQGPPAEIVGPADVLFLLLWGRTDLDDAALRFSGPDDVRAELQAAQFAP